MFCRKCGIQLKSGAKFCQKCGNPVAAAEPRLDPAMPPPQPAARQAAESQPGALDEPRRKATIPPPPTVDAARPVSDGPLDQSRTRRSANIVIAVLIIVAVAGAGYLMFNRRTVPDPTIVANLTAKFGADQSLHNSMIRITSENGVVTLAGFVGTDADKSTAVRIAGAEPGVKQVIAQLMPTSSTIEGITKILTSVIPVQAPGPGTGTSGASGGEPTSQNSQPGMPPTQTDQTPIATPPHTRPTIVQAVLQEGGTSLQLAPGQMYIYGMVTGGAFPSSPFAVGNYAQATNAAGQLCAALAYGSESQNSYTTQTGAHVIGGVSVSGTWDDLRAYYGSNPRAGASIVAAPFVVREDSLVVVIASAASEKQLTLYGVEGLQIDASSSGGVLPMVIGHAYLPAGNYTASETSSAVGGQDAEHMADLIGVFVFGFQR